MISCFVLKSLLIFFSFKLWFLLPLCSFINSVQVGESDIITPQYSGTDLKGKKGESDFYLIFFITRAGANKEFCTEK